MKLHESTAGWSQKTNYEPFFIKSFRNIIRNCYWDRFIKIFRSSRSSRPEVFDKKRVLNNFTGKHMRRILFFDKAAGWRPETLLKPDFSKGLFLCIFLNTFSCELLDILLLLVDIIFLIVLLLVVLPYQICDKIFVNNPNGKTKSCFHVVGCHFSECLLAFYLNLIGYFFLLENPPRKLKILNFF